MASVRPTTPDYSITATVAVNGTASGAVDLLDCQLCGIFVPSTFDGTDITFQASADGTNFFAVEDGEGAAYTLVTTVSRYAPIPNLAILAGVRYLKVVCTSTQTSTSTVFTLAVRPV